MYNLHQLTDKTYYIDGTSVIGLFKLNHIDVIMIDSSDNLSAAKFALDVIQEHAWTLKAIVNTHCHADHTTGNAYLQEQTGCKIYASELEAWWINHTEMCPSFDFGGFPFRELKNRIFVAKSSHCDTLDGVCLEGLTVIALPGHAAGEIGILTDDGVFFTGDAVCGEDMIKHSRIVYNFDIERVLQSFETVKNTPAKWYVLSHSEPLQDIEPLIRFNAENIDQTQQLILSLCQTPLTVDELIEAVFNKLELSMNTSQYVIIGTTLRNHLSYLRNKRMLRPVSSGKIIRWHTVIEN